MSSENRNPIYRPPEPDVEARSRLLSLLSVCEHELASLEELHDARLTRILENMRTFHAELLAALNEFREGSLPA